MTPVQLSVGTAEDCERIAAVAAATFGLACPPTADPADIDAFIATQLCAARFADYLADARRTLLLATAGDEAVGYAMIVDSPPVDDDVVAAVTARPAVELSKFYLLAAHHGSGVAAAMMAAAWAHARDAGAAAMWLGVNEHNHRAKRFYTRHGFRVTGRRTFPLGSTVEQDYVMVRLMPEGRIPAG